DGGGAGGLMALGLERIQALRIYSFANTSSAASSVALITASSWAPETKPASNADGAKYTPRISMPWKNFLKRSTSQVETSANEVGTDSEKYRPNIPPT